MTQIREIDGLYWKPEYKYRQVPFKECAVAGLSFHVDRNDELWDELEEGVSLALVRDRHNSHDRNAVAVALADDYDGDAENFDFKFAIGYVPRSENAELAAFMDAGYDEKFSAKITTYRRHGNLNDRIRITIYIESNEPELVRPDLLRAESISTSELRRMSMELEEKGFTLFRFSGFPLHDLQSPVEGEKIVMVHQDGDDAVLYLMRVLAADAGCARYLDDPESINRCDDCLPYILTNVMGPVMITPSDHPFLQGADLKGFEATAYLNRSLSDGFNGIFRSVLSGTLSSDNMDIYPGIDEQ